MNPPKPNISRFDKAGQNGKPSEKKTATYVRKITHLVADQLEKNDI